MDNSSANSLLDEEIEIDSSRLKQIIVNLLSNAIKYTEKGIVKITSEVKDDKLMISIIDTGVGMSQLQTKQLFTNFTKFMTNRHLN